MARISKEEALAMDKLIADVIFDLFLEKGIEFIGYRTIIEHAKNKFNVKITQGAIQNRYKASEFYKAFNGKLRPYLRSKVTTTTTVEEYERTWTESLDDKGLFNIINFILLHESSEPQLNKQTLIELNTMLRNVEDRFGQEGLDMFHRMVGKFYIHNRLNRVDEEQEEETFTF